MGAHSLVMDRPAAFIERYHRWSYQMRNAFRELSSETGYHYWFDPFWIRAEPYRVKVKRGESVAIQLHVRNFNARPQRHRIDVHTPSGLVAETPLLEGKLAKSLRATFPVRLRATPDAATGVHLIAFDVTLDGRRFGERFDCIVQIDP